MGASVVARSDAPPVLEAAEGVLDVVAMPIECLVVRHRDLALSGGWDARLDASCQEVGAKADVVIAAVDKQLARLRENRQKRCSAFVVVAQTSAASVRPLKFRLFANRPSFVYLISYTVDWPVRVSLIDILLGDLPCRHALSLQGTSVVANRCLLVWCPMCGPGGR